MKKYLKQIVQWLLARRGLTLAPLNSPSQGCSLGYIGARETVLAAEQAGLSVCDYVERLWDKQGDTARVIEQLARLELFRENSRVIEIGAGTGRYMEKVLAKCSLQSYESYETARDWSSWLQKKYPIIAHEADGVSLKQSGDGSADFVHAHGVFVYLPFLVSYRYWQEIWRVTAVHGKVAFDIISETCLDDVNIGNWLASGHNYPCFLSRSFVIEAFERQGFTLSGSFYNRYGEGRSEYLVFHRQSRPS